MYQTLGQCTLRILRGGYGNWLSFREGYRKKSGRGQRYRSNRLLEGDPCLSAAISRRESNDFRPWRLHWWWDTILLWPVGIVRLQVWHSTRLTAWSTGLLGVPPPNLTPQLTRTTVWPIVANWSQHHIHRCHPRWLTKSHRRISEMTSGKKGQNKLIRGSPINISLDWQSAQVGPVGNRITSNGAIVQCVATHSQLYKRRSLLDTLNKPTSHKKITHNVSDDEMLS